MGYYKCIRCGGGDVYVSEENGRTYALTLDTPGPVDPTLFNTFKEKVTRCRNCGEKSNYIMSAAEREEDYRLGRLIVNVLLRANIALWAFFGAVFIYSRVTDASSWPRNIGFEADGNADLLFWIGVVCVVLAPTLFLRTFVTFTLRTRIGLWLVTLLGFLGLAMLPWANEWVRLALLVLSITAFVWIGLLFVMYRKDATALIPFAWCLPAFLGAVSFSYWSTEWVGLIFLLLSLVALVFVPIVIFVSKYLKSRSKPQAT